MTEHAVVVAGAGPTGMMLGAELTLAGIDVVVVERRATPVLDNARSRGLHARTIEVLDQRGVADRFLAAGYTAQVQGFSMIPLDISDFPTRHPYGLALSQNEFERILAGWIDELGVRILRDRAVTGITQDEHGVDVALADGESLRARFLVGCDGGRSVVRKAAGIEFPGWDPSVRSFITEVELRDEPAVGIRRDERGQHAMALLDGGVVAVVVSEPYNGQSGEPTFDDLRRAMAAAWGTDFGVHNPRWISRFTDMTRQAASYRSGRVLLAGDAAHVHYPIGGQGLNVGVQDAVNLGWKLALVVKDRAPESLLDTYHAERHPVAARVLQNTMAQTALTRVDARVGALRDTLAELLAMDQPRKRIAGMISGLDIQYDLADGHPLLGRRMPDLDVHTTDGRTRLFTLLHAARPLLLTLGTAGPIDVAPWADRVRCVEARCEGRWALPVIGEVPAPGAVLIRPDGHVAWIGDEAATGLADALTTWFGPPAA